MPYIPTKNRPFPSLGWRVIDHVEDFLGIELMEEQAVRLVHLYRLDLKGRRVYRRAALRRPKGSGKSPEGGYIGFAELTGPVVFAGWDSKGQPIGERHPNPWIQFAAVSEDQTVNVSVWLSDILAGQPNTLRELAIDLGRTRIYLKDGPGRIEMVTAEAGSREGQPVTFAVLDQTEAWLQRNGGHRLAATLRRNAAKTRGWTYELQNSPDDNEDSVALRTEQDWQKGQSGLFFDTREPDPLPDLDAIRQRAENGVAQPEDHAELIKALAQAYGESATRGFVDLERQASECLDMATSPSDAYRFYLNVKKASEEVWIDAPSWNARAVRVLPEKDDEIGAGFWGGSHSGAMLVGVKIKTGELFVIASWDTGEALVPKSEVQAEVEQMVSRYTVQRFLVGGMEYWGAEYDAWHLAWGEMVIARPSQQTAKMAYAVDQFRTALLRDELHHDGNPVLRRQVTSALTRKVPAGTLITPKTDDPPDHISGARAAVLAWEARTIVLREEADDGPSAYEERGLVTF